MGVNTDGMTELEGVRAAVEAVRNLSLSIGIPQKLHEINVREEDLHQLAIDAFNDVCTGVILVPLLSRKLKNYTVRLFNLYRTHVILRQ